MFHLSRLVNRFSKRIVSVYAPTRTVRYPIDITTSYFQSFAYICIYVYIYYIRTCFFISFNDHCILLQKLKFLSRSDRGAYTYLWDVIHLFMNLGCLSLSRVIVILIFVISF